MTIVSKVTSYGLNVQSLISGRSKVFSHCHYIQTRSVSHQASCPVQGSRRTIP